MKQLVSLIFSFFVLLIPSQGQAFFHTTDTLPKGVTTIQETVALRKSGEVLINNKPTSRTKIDTLADRYVFRYKVVDRPGKNLSQIKVTVQLPEGVSTKEVMPIFYAVHGVSQYDHRITDVSMIEFSAFDVSPEATVSIRIDMPRTALSLSSWQRIAMTVQVMSLSQWIAVAVVIPASMVLFAFIVLIRRARDIFLRPAKVILQEPPSTLPPALVGTLIHGYVGMREIAATLVDLAERGYIDIIYRAEDDFAFSQKRKWQDDATLVDFERFFLSQIFSEEVISDRRVISQKLNRHVWSESVSKGIEHIYAQMVDLGYFERNPKQTHLVIRTAGIILFFISVFGLAISLSFFTQQPLVVLPWVASMIFSPLMIRLAVIVPRRTKAGREQAARWLAFGHFLTAPIDVAYTDLRDDYEKYLAYSIVLSIESRWTERFVNTPCRIPSWFFSQDVYIDSYAKLVNALFGIVGFIGQRFSLSRRPTAI